MDQRIIADDDQKSRKELAEEPSWFEFKYFALTLHPRANTLEPPSLSKCITIGALTPTRHTKESKMNTITGIS